MKFYTLYIYLQVQDTAGKEPMNLLPSSVQQDTRSFHWPNEVLLAGASKGPMMLAHWDFTSPGVQIMGQ